MGSSFEMPHKGKEWPSDMRQRDADCALRADALSSGGQLPVPPALVHAQTYSAFFVYSIASEKVVVNCFSAFSR